MNFRSNVGLLSPLESWTCSFDVGRISTNQNIKSSRKGIAAAENQPKNPNLLSSMLNSTQHFHVSFHGLKHPAHTWSLRLSCLGLRIQSPRELPRRCTVVSHATDEKHFKWQWQFCKGTNMHVSQSGTKVSQICLHSKNTKSIEPGLGVFFETENYPQQDRCPSKV